MKIARNDLQQDLYQRLPQQRILEVLSVENKESPITVKIEIGVNDKIGTVKCTAVTDAEMTL